MADIPKPEMRYMLTFQDEVVKGKPQTYEAGPFVYVCGRWVHDEARYLEALGNILSWRPTKQ